MAAATAAARAAVVTAAVEAVARAKGRAVVARARQTAAGTVAAVVEATWGTVDDTGSVAAITAAVPRREARAAETAVPAEMVLMRMVGTMVAVVRRGASRSALWR